MKRLLIGLSLVLATIAVVSFAGSAPATDRLLVPEQTNLPYWERGLGVSNDGTAVFVFYRPLADVPSTFNFHDFFDFSIDPSVPLLVQGFLLFDEGAAVPKQIQLQNAEGSQVVICFVDADELLPIYEDGNPFTIGDLLGMESLQIGQADFYHETLHPFDPTDPSAPSVLEVAARGVLEDGRSFFVQTAASQTIVRIGQ